MDTSFWFTFSPLHNVQELPDRDFASISAFCEQFVVTLVNEHSDAIRG
jgi:hypothetical protein